MSPLATLIVNWAVLTIGLGIWCGGWTLYGRWAKKKDKMGALNFAWIMGGMPALLAVYRYVYYIMVFTESAKKTIH